jgi:four helix bundle protein
MQRQAARKFSDLLVWQRSHEFVLAVYKLTEQFPANEIYGLTSQLRRAAVSIPANVAEGFKRRGRLDKGRFLKYLRLLPRNVVII